MESMMNSKKDLANQVRLRLDCSRLLFSAPMRNKKSMKCVLDFETYTALKYLRTLIKISK